MRKFGWTLSALLLLPATAQAQVTSGAPRTQGAGDANRGDPVNVRQVVCSAGTCTATSASDASAANQGSQITAAILTNTTLGAVTASPTANTIGDRLKTINTTLGSPLQAGSVLRLTNGAIPAGSPTYTASGLGYTAYATPTDMICIRGSATKTVAVSALAISPQATATVVGTYYWIKRSTANTGGTSTNPLLIPHDSTDAAATAVIDLYTAAPTTGTAVGNLAATNISQTVLTAGTNPVNFYTSALTYSDATQVADFRKPFILRGVAEEICINFNGAAIPVGYAAGWVIKLTEY